jgi:anti-sigma B factor antagonist
MDLSISSRPVRDWTVVDVQGEVDIFTAPKLREQIGDLVDQGHTRIAVDLLGVAFMDSSGLGALVGSLKRVKERDGVLSLVCAGGPVMRVLSITGLHNVLPVYSTVDEATSAR